MMSHKMNCLMQAKQMPQINFLVQVIALVDLPRNHLALAIDRISCFRLVEPQEDLV